MAKMKRIVCFGDSITACGGFSAKTQWPNVVQNNLETSHPGKFEVFNRGIGGNTTYDGILRLSTILNLKPDYVIVEFGYNDSVILTGMEKSKVSVEEFSKNLEQFYRSFKKIKAQTIFVVNHPTKHRGSPAIDKKKSYESVMKKFDTAIRKTAAKLKCPLIDLPKEIKRRKIKEKEFINSNDGLHLSEKGGQEYGNIVYGNILKII